MKLFKIETFNNTTYAFANCWDTVDRYYKVFSERSVKEVRKLPPHAEVLILLDCYTNDDFVYIGKIENIKKHVKHLGNLRKVVGVAYYGD